MTTRLDALRRDSYRDIALYAPDRRPCAVDLSDNTNLWGVPPTAGQTIRDAAGAAMTRYPDLYARPLKAVLADYCGVTPDMIVTGCGSDDVLDSAIRAFARPGAGVVGPNPSFAMIPLFAAMNGLDYRAVELNEQYDVDADAFTSGGGGIAYLCSPNNPTGTALGRTSIERVVDGFDGIVIIDEAYAEFAGVDALDLARSRENVLVTRTLSKAFGLAGLRVGYAVGAPELVREVEKSRGPYKISALAEAAAVAAVRDDAAWVREHVAAAVAARTRLTEVLRTLGLEPLPSSANFVLVPIESAGDVATAMRDLGVAVRPFVDLPPVSEPLRRTNGAALRITVGPWEMVDAAVTALRQVMKR